MRTHAYDMHQYKDQIPAFVEFLDSSPSPFHAVSSAKKLLDQAGFQSLSEDAPWPKDLKPNSKYYLSRNGSSLIAFVTGNELPSLSQSPMAIVAAHTDSPCFHLKPHSRQPERDGYIQIGVAPYGGGQWKTWFDRDLSVAGRVIVKQADSPRFKTKLVQVKKPVLRIPTLAIHLNRDDNAPYNKEDHLLPIAGLISKEVNKRDEVEEEGDGGAFEALEPLSSRHHPRLLKLIAKEAGVEVADIVDFDLVLYDTQKATIGGMDDEFILSARLDNLCMSYAAIQALISYSTAPVDGLRIVSLFDNEEIGSETAVGADSTFLPGVIKCLYEGLDEAQPGQAGDRKTVPNTQSALSSIGVRSLLVSADMAHAVHPNYAGKHEAQHRPRMNEGPVIKVNANGRYATLTPGRVALAELGKMSGVPLQLFVIRNDSLCGSTVGPFLNSWLSMPTVDIGNAQLSMHSIREICGAADVIHAIRLFEGVFQHYGVNEGAALSHLAQVSDC